jgi:hypothetical protein
LYYFPERFHEGRRGPWADDNIRAEINRDYGFYGRRERQHDELVRLTGL